MDGSAAWWRERILAEARLLFDHLPSETELFLSGYGTRITPVISENAASQTMGCVDGGAPPRFLRTLLGCRRENDREISQNCNAADRSHRNGKNLGFLQVLVTPA